MNELLILKTPNANKLKTVLAKNHIEYQIIYTEPLTAKKSTKKDKLQEYIEMKSKENIFADYGKAIKDREREKEAKEWDEMEIADWE